MQARDTEFRGQPPALPERPFADSPQTVLAALAVDPASGLSPAEVARRRALYGPNLTAEAPAEPHWRILLRQLRSPVVFLLLGAALLAFQFDEWIEGFAVLAVLAVNTVIGFATEVRAIRSMEALRVFGSRSAKVLREGQLQVVDAAEVVPGDIVVVEAGDAVAADLRLVEADGLAADESVMTGESVPVEKSTGAVDAAARVAEQGCMLFRGSSVVRGHGKAVAVATGEASEFGRISAMVASASSERTPIERGLAELAGQMVWLTLGLAFCVAAIGFLRGADMLLMAKTAVALAVAAIPEGLPIVATLALARGVWRMAGKNALVERLSAVETLGATTLIITDKTGTLTENRMRLARVALASGEIAFERAPADGTEPGQLLRDLLEAGVLCSSAALGEDGHDDVGDPMELALLQAARSAGLERAGALRGKPQVAIRPFATETRMMATVHAEGEGFYFAVKGAPEAVMPHCTHVAGEAGPLPFDATPRKEWGAELARLASQGLRVIAVAAKRSGECGEDPFGGLVLLGLAALEDPARAEVPAAIRLCREAGVGVVMVTGDHATTAHSIGRKVGIGSDGMQALEGRDLARLDGNGEALRQTCIFARVSPDEKLALVRAFQAEGEVVAMTGDGVNDAPALRQADIGVAMGMRGTDVAREAAEMVLLDDSFATIPAAIREGRVIFANIRRFAAYLLSCNFSEVLVVGLAILFALPLPLLPLQILYLNLVTDVFPAFALATGEGDENIMRRPPRSPQEPILGKPQWRRLVVHGLVLSGATFGAMALGQGVFGFTEEELVTTTFLTIAFSQLLHVFNMRHPQSHPLRNEVAGNPWVWAALALCCALLFLPPFIAPLAAVMRLVPPSGEMWAVIFAMSFASLAILQIGTVLAARGRA